MDVATFQTDEPVVALLGPERDRASAALPPQARPCSLDDVAELTTLVGGERIDCVVLAIGSEPSVEPEGVLEAVRAHAESLPIVVVASDPAPAVARTLAMEPATTYLPDDGGTAESAEDRPGTISELAGVVAAAVERYDRRRQDVRERRMFRELMEMAPLSIYVKDAEARHVAVSDAAEDVAEGTVVGKSDLDLFGRTSDESLPRSYLDDLGVLESGEPLEDLEERTDRPGGESLWMRTTKVPRRDEDGEVVGLLGVTRDVSAEKRREQQLQRESRRLEQFASFASHDLRNPLTVAAGNLELAREAEDPAVAEDHLGRVADALDRMETLIGDLLDIARPDEERDAVWTELRAVTDRAWTAVDASDAELTINLPEDYEVRAASGALRQLLENVLGNAVAHGGAGVHVEVGTTPTGFYVADDGPGIPEADREAVFEYGYTTGGSGIGLAITKEVVDAHDWTVRVIESAGGGARFEFDRCLTRWRDAPAPVEGERLALGDWRTVGDLVTTDDDSTVVSDDPEAAGVVEEGDGTVAIRGGGRALWGGIEEYACYAADVEGGVRIEGKVLHVESVHEYSKAGLLLADATESGRPLGFVGKTADHGTEAAWRSGADGPVDTHQAEPDAELPRWYRVDRLGDRVRFFGSTDGERWTMIDQHVLPLADPIAVGLAVNSHEAGTTCEARFEDVRVVALRPGEDRDA